MIKVVNNKKLDMTEDEWQLYQKIVKSYTTVSNKGEDLFIDLFETNDEGIIVYLKPPSKRQTSLEVFLFLVSLITHQHLREAYKGVEDIRDQMQNKLNEINIKLAELDKKLNAK